MFDALPSKDIDGRRAGLPFVIANATSAASGAHNNILGFTIGELWWWVGGVGMDVPCVYRDVA